MNESDFVRQDLHDANMKEIRALIAASEARHEKTAAEMRENNTRQYTQFLEAVRSDMQNMKNDIVNMINIKLTSLAVFLTILFALLEYLRR